MGGSTGNGMMSGMAGANVLPAWLGWICFAIYLVILVIHFYHLLTMRGLHRAWHAGHVLMALGMAWMFLPVPPFIIPALAWQSVFALAACLIAGWCLWGWFRRQAVSLLWVTLLIGMLAMIYMFTFPGAATQYLTYILVVYFLLESIAWFSGAFAGARKAGEGRRGLVSPASDACGNAVFPFIEARSLDMRLTLGLMALGMGYMFFVMELSR